MICCGVVSVVWAAVVVVTRLQRRRLGVSRRRRVDKSWGELYQSRPGMLFGVQLQFGWVGARARCRKAIEDGHGR